MSLPIKIQVYINKMFEQFAQDHGLGKLGINAGRLRGTLPVTVLPPHASRHQNGGNDEINVAGLSGELADPQPPKSHDITAHTATGGSEGDVPTVQRDGSIALQAPAGVGAHTILSASHTDTDSADTPAEGDALVWRSDEWVAEAGVGIDSDDAMIPAVNLVEQASDPTAPGVDHTLVYAKSDGLYTRRNGGEPTKVGSGSGHTIEDEGAALTQRETLNFTGPGVVASDTGSKTQVRVSRWEPLMDGAGGFVLTDAGDIIECEFVT
jgi:hypothetical protein